ncbi:MAG: asparagine synthase (glutamine-hydrolyzing) [Chloroflexi bacterium]|nr:asparagine synthase (glutamine-hydrolyzing) [Chloroflexota bacterium]
MCGIAGIFNTSGAPVDAAAVRRMADAQRHRGPDDAGLFVEGNVGLGHRRLSIIDLSEAGHQPMPNEDGSLQIVYNGETYNFRDLVPELQGCGHVFRSRTDTEVVLHAYEEWGEECVHRLNGMFAFAIWDGPRQRLFMARDRFGIKPLYYAFRDGRFLFASEVKGLLASGLVKAAVDPEALSEYFTFQNVLSDRTLFAGVRMLPVGHVLTVTREGVHQRQYWDLAYEEGGEVGEDQLRETVEQAVARQLVSDVPLGCYLSGGMDSASLVAVASRHIPRFTTFTTGFDLTSVTGMELAFDERADAEVVACTFGTEHYETVLHAGDMAWCLPRLVWHLEDLRAGTSYQNWYTSRLIGRFVKVALAGVGGDEMFAGYPWRYQVVEGCEDLDEFRRRHYVYWCRLVSDADKPAFFSPGLWAQARGYPTFDVYRSVVDRAAHLSPLNRALYFEVKTFLHGILMVEDKISMAHSLEVRVPFLDDALVECASRIPASQKLRNGEGKYLLRRAMTSLLPPGIVTKKKQGFSPPDGSWYRGPTMAYIQEVLLDPRTLSRGYFQPEYVRKVVQEHLEGKVNHRLLIWSLLCFEWWNRIFLDGEVPGPDGARGLA